MISDECLDISIAGDLYVGAENEIEVSERTCRKLSNRDLVCVNLEGPICKGRAKLKKIGPNLSQTEEAVRVLKRIGCRLVTLANNHMMDYGAEGLTDTLECLREAGIAWMGAGTGREGIYKSHMIEKNGVRLGIINAAENGFGCLDDFSTDHAGYAWMFSRNIQKEIQRLKLREKCDQVIGIFHAGAEDVHYPLPEWRAVYRDFIDAGMDLVAAHHPHVPQGCETYSGKRIYYSLGNFMWYGAGEQEKCPADAQEGKFGLILNLHIEKDKGMEESLSYVNVDGNVMEEAEKGKADAMFDQWSRLLKEENDEEYCRTIKEMCNDLYENLYQRYMKETIGILQDRNAGKLTRLKQYLLNVKRALLSDYKINESMLFHNLQIETHRWVCTRVIKENEGIA